MRLQIDKQADGLYLRLDDSDIVESVEVAPDKSVTIQDACGGPRCGRVR